MAETLVGDIIDIEHTDDHTASTPTWNKVGKTTDAMEIAPNVETASRRHHEDFQMDKAAVSEAWEITFSSSIVTGTAQLETVDLIDTSSYELQGYADTRESGNAADAITMTAYASEADKASGTVKWETGTSDYLLTVGSGEVNVEDFSTREFVIHSRVPPVRLDAGGSL
jgi:hypothetical protein